jgi:hypothetical protein
VPDWLIDIVLRLQGEKPPSPLKRKFGSWVLRNLPGMLSCAEFEEFVADYYEDEVTPDVRRKFDNHMKLCPMCRVQFDSYLRAVELGRRVCEDEDRLPESMPEELVGAILSSTVLMGLAGGAFAAWLGTSRGRMTPIIVGSLVSVAGRWLFIHSSTAEMVFLAGLLWGLGFYFVTPYQVGLLAELDRSGRLAVAAGAAGNFGYGLGPAVAGRVLESYDPSAFLYIVVGGTALSLVFLFPLTMEVERRARSNTQ